MLLVDYSHLVIGAAQWWYAKGDKSPMTMDLMRRLTLTSIIDLKEKMRGFSDEIVLAMDSRVGYWRKDVFPYYKAKRKEARVKAQEKGSFDWDAFYPCMDQMKIELQENFNVACIQVDKAEADDVIAVLAKYQAPYKKIGIAASDTDFVQLQHIHPSIKQWSASVKKYITPANQEYSLFEHIVRGDTGDGIPNILSDDDTFVDPDKRQTPIKAVTIEGWSKYGIMQPEKFCNSLETLERFGRNRRLVDFDMIPEDIAGNIVSLYNSTTPAKGKAFDYMVAHRLTKVMERGGI